MYLILFSILFVVSVEIFLLINAKKIGNIIAIIDIPDQIRKFHKIPVPLLGGPVLFITIFLNAIIFNYLGLPFLQFEIVLFLFCITMFGLLDDKYNLNANLKLIFLALYFAIFFLLNNDLLVEELRFSSFRFKLNIYEYLITFFTILCSLLLINSINMFDGKNGLCASIQIIILLFLIYYIFKHQYHISKNLNFFENELVFIYLYIIYLLLFLIFNFKSKIFLGDSGAYLGGFIIIYLILSIYPKNLFLNCEEIFFLLMIPGIDMLRLFLIRIKNKKNPFNPDNKHLHHLISKKIKSHTKITIIISMALLITNLLINLFSNHTLIILILSISTYILTVNKLNNYEN